ncbi:hypothetical protein Dimus_027322 [Dionaea muscipula]
MLLSCSQPSNPRFCRALQPWPKQQRLNFLPHSNLKIKPPPPTACSCSSSKICCGLGFGLEDIAAFAHNKVLVAAALSGAIGQLSKPFTSVLLYRKPLIVKAAVQAGGFPSTHSSTVVATAVSLGLDRGFSDSIFGLAVVYATLVMYDAQGVRREVGNHAKTINKLMVKRQMISATTNEDGSTTGPQQAFTLQKVGVHVSENSSVGQEEKTVSGKENMEPELTVSKLVIADNEIVTLNESVGHTELEVIAGAILGFFVSLVVFYQL